MSSQPISIKEFASRIKTKYPDYADVPDADLAQRFIAKYPEYRSQVAIGDPSPTDILGQGGMAGPISRAALARSLAQNLGNPQQVPEAPYSWGLETPEDRERAKQDALNALVNAGRGAKGAVAGILSMALPPRSPAERALFALGGPGAVIAKRTIAAPIEAIQQARDLPDEQRPAALAQFGGSLLANAALGKAGKVAYENLSPAARAVKNAAISNSARLQVADVLGLDARGAADLDVAVPRIVKAVGGKQNIATISDFRQAADEALTQGTQEFRNKFITPVAKTEVPLDSVADRISGLITDDMRRSQPALAKSLAKKADAYRGQSTTVEQLYQDLIDTNKKLDALAKQSPSKQRISVATPGLGWQVAKAEAFRNLLYDNLPPSAMVENRTLGAIGGLKDAAQKAEDAASLTGKEGALAKAKRAANVALPALRGDIKTSALRYALGGAQEHPDIWFGKAWKNLRISVPEELNLRPAGLLKASVITPAPQDTSGISVVRGQYGKGPYPGQLSLPAGPAGLLPEASRGIYPGAPGPSESQAGPMPPGGAGVLGPQAPYENLAVPIRTAKPYNPRQLPPTSTGRAMPASFEQLPEPIKQALMRLVLQGKLGRPGGR